MPWYKTGTVSVTQNSNAVIGTGTAFIANSRVGDGFRGPDGRWYEVTNIASNTALSISPNYEGPTVADGFYSIMPVQGYQKDLSDQVRAILNDYGDKLALLGTTGNYDILPPSKGGTGITDLSAFIQGLLNDADAPAARATLVAAKSGVNADITELSALTKPITSQQGGVAESYIEGLLPVWYSANSIGIDTGAAYIPGAGKTLKVSSPIVKSGLAPATNTWYYVYLFDNFGTPDLNFSNTPPSAPYLGAARTKTGDNSMRFIAALRVGPAGFRPFLIVEGMIAYADTSALYSSLSNGTATVSTAVDMSPVVPPTSRSCRLAVYGPVAGGTLSVGLGAVIQLSCAAGNRYVATAFTDSAQKMAYSHNSAVTTGGSTLDVRAYGMER
jgi:hypothetical protein